MPSLPKVSGGEPYLDREANAVLQKASEAASSKMGDQFVALESILMALLQTKSSGRFMKDAGINEKRIGRGY